MIEKSVTIYDFSSSVISFMFLVRLLLITWLIHFVASTHKVFGISFSMSKKYIIFIIVHFFFWLLHFDRVWRHLLISFWYHVVCITNWTDLKWIMLPYMFLNNRFLSEFLSQLDSWSIWTFQMFHLFLHENKSKFCESSHLQILASISYYY